LAGFVRLSEACVNKAKVLLENPGGAVYNIRRGEGYKGGTEDAEEDREGGRRIIG